MKVFVYGTLMDGEPNNVFLRKDAVFLGDGETKPLYTLYDLNAFPAMVFGGDTSIKGEVYEVSKEALEDMKLRDRNVAALAYFLDEIPLTMRSRPHPIISSGDWREALKGDYVEDEPLNNKKWK